MAIKVSRQEVWSVTIDDRAGAVADKLEALAKAGANLEMVFARRRPEQPGSGVIFAAPIKGAKVTRAAQEAGFAKADNMFGVKVEGGDKPGLGARITRALGNAGVSFRGISAHAIGSKFISNIVVDSDQDAANAVAALKKLK
jgi:predicted amino acid-binding ACT domain protein